MKLTAFLLVTALAIIIIRLVVIHADAIDSLQISPLYLILPLCAVLLLGFVMIRNTKDKPSI